MADKKRGQGRGTGSFEPGRRVEVDARLGQLYETRDVATGAPGLTLVPKTDVDWQPEGPCRMSLTYEPARESVTVAVEQAPAAVRTSELTNLLVMATAVFRRVEDDTRVEAHLSSGLSGRLGAERSRRGRGLSSWGGLAAGVAVLVVGLGVWSYSTRASHQSVFVEAGEVVERLPPLKIALIDRGASDMPAASYPIPDKPVPQQAVAPCEIESGEVEINKGCWMELARKPPCARNQAEHQGKCYMPVRKPTPVPQSVKP